MVRTCGHDASGHQLAIASSTTITDGTHNALSLSAHSRGTWGDAVAISIEHPWTAQTSGVTTDLHGVHFASATAGWAVGVGGVIRATTDGGATWTAQTSGVTTDLHGVHFGSTMTGWAVGAGGVIRVTTNGGTAWTAQTSGVTTDLHGVHFASATAGWAVGAGGRILATTNGGATWTAQTSGVTTDLHGVHFASTTAGWAVGAGGRILATTNGGATWTAQTSGVTTDLHGVYFVSAMVGWAVGAGGVILATANGGATWTAQQSGTRQTLHAVHFQNATTGWASGVGGVILATSSGGAIWAVQDSGARAALRAVRLVDAQRSWVVGAGGVIRTTTVAAGSAPAFQLRVFYRGEQVERYDAVVLDPDAVASVEDAVNDVSKAIRVNANPNDLFPLPDRPLMTIRRNLSGGSDGTASLVDSDFTGTDGLQAFDPIDNINIVAVPDRASRDVMLAGINYCENRGDCFFLVAAPDSIDTAAEALAYKQATGPEFSGQNAFNSSFGALYVPWVEVADPLTRKTILVPPVGVVAGRYSATDVRRGVHKAPAGIEDGLMRGVLGLARLLSRAELEVLNPINVNVLRDVKGVGRVIWGARTLSANPALRYVSTRRLLLFIEESIDEGTQWVVFEPNTPELWRTIERNVRAFLRVVWRSGALFGETEERAFYVKCDRETNTPDSIEAGQVITEIGVAITKPAEFVIFRIAQSRAGAEISE